MQNSSIVCSNNFYTADNQMIDNLTINTKEIVKELKKAVSIENIICEAITNSIQANATIIKINIKSNSLIADDDKKIFTDTLSVSSIDIIDNGDGFTEENIRSFKQYRSGYKKEMGAKGIGRFLFLKLFKKVEINSLDKHIIFSKTENNINIDNVQYQEDTIVSLISPENDIKVNLETLSQNIKEHFLPYFVLIKDEPLIVIRALIDNNPIFKITSSDTPEFKSSSFKIDEHQFNTQVLIGSDIKTSNGFYCAGNRVVLSHKKLNFDNKFRFIADIPMVFLLSSTYLDENVNDERIDFNIEKHEKGIGQLSWQDIQHSLRKHLHEILIECGVNLDKISKDRLKKAINKAPYLAYYLQDNENCQDDSELIDEAKKQFNEDKKTLRAGNGEDGEYYKKLSIVTQAELAEYVYDRAKLIEKLKTIVDENLLEKEVHNLFMKKNTTLSLPSYKDNHLWLFDDRFMSYDKAFSDTKIKDVFPQLHDILDRPDILTIISNTYDKEKITDIVVIEFKQPKETITPAGAEEQLLKYARYINNANIGNKIRIWMYAFLKFNNEVEEALNDKSYNKIITHSEFPIYYSFHEKHNVIINFMDYKSLITDAEMRNKTFFDILTGKGNI